jgi:hypothetical protein
VQQPEEAAPEPEAQRHRGLRLVDERGVVELELVEGLAQVGVVRAVQREEPEKTIGLGSRYPPSASVAGLAALVTVSPTLDWRTSFTPVMR